jgi:hypothetical protein
MKLPLKARVQLLKNAVKSSPQQAFLKSDLGRMAKDLGINNLIDETCGLVEATAGTELRDEGYFRGMKIDNPKGRGNDVRLWIKLDNS